MEVVAALIMILLAALIVLYVGAQAVRGTVDILSTRNMFLIGLIVFQITGPAVQILVDAQAHFQPSNLPETSMIYTMMLFIFVGLFLLSYNKSTRAIDGLISKHQPSPRRYSSTGLMIIAFTTVPVGIACQFVLVYIPVLGPGFRMLGFGMYAVGSGLASWVWFKHFFNPVYFVLACAIILMAMGLTFYENFGRRPLLGIVAGIGWAAYYSHWRSLGFGAVIKRGIVVAGAGFFLLALVTSSREGGFRDRSALENVSTLKDASFSSGAIDLLTGQEAGMNSMWLIEVRPNLRDYDTLHTVYSVLTFPIPRAIWPDKPTALAISMPRDELRISGKAKDWNIGPGIIGHIENDNPWIALWLYPLFLGFYFRVLDRIVVWFPDNPFAVLPMGAALGQIIAMPRGELGSFFFIATINIFGSFAIMFVFSLVFKQFGLMPQVGEDEFGYDDDYGSDYLEDEVYTDQYASDSSWETR